MSKVLQARTALKKKREELLKDITSEYKCPAVFRPNQHTDRGSINLRAANTHQIKSAVKSMLLDRQANEFLVEEIKHDGFMAEEWLADFKVRMGVLSRSKKLAAIDDLAEEVEAMMDAGEMRDFKLPSMLERIENL